MSKEGVSNYEDPAGPVDRSPHPFKEIPALWVKVPRMTEEFFAQEAPRASGSNVLIGVLILALVSAISNVIYDQVFSRFQLGFLRSGLFALFAVLLGFYLFNGLVYLGARILGGNGNFGIQTYLLSLFTVPIGIVASLMVLVPCAGGIGALVLLIYRVVLDVRAIKVVHNLTTGKAVVAVLALPWGLSLTACCLTFLIFARSIYS